MDTERTVETVIEPEESHQIAEIGGPDDQQRPLLPPAVARQLQVTNEAIYKSFSPNLVMAPALKQLQKAASVDLSGAAAIARQLQAANEAIYKSLSPNLVMAPALKQLQKAASVDLSGAATIAKQLQVTNEAICKSFSPYFAIAPALKQLQESVAVDLKGTTIANRLYRRRTRPSTSRSHPTLQWRRP